jgi:hypothetical protein
MCDHKKDGHEVRLLSLLLIFKLNSVSVTIGIAYSLMF